MIKRLITTTVAAGLMVTLFCGIGQAASLVKIGIVDLQSALNATAQGVAAKDRLRNKHLAKKEQVDSMRAELDALEEKIKSPVLSEEAQAELKEKYLRQRAELIEFVTKAREEEERDNQAFSAPILEGLIEIAREIGEAENYTVILEKSGSSVIYFEESMDITEKVVKTYNERNQEGEEQ